jgi:hypothetical protein
MSRNSLFKIHNGGRQGTSNLKCSERKIKFSGKYDAIFVEIYIKNRNKSC